MAKRARSKSTAAPRAIASSRTKAPEVARYPLTPAWRTSSWKMWPMIFGIRQEDYERTAAAFEAHHRGQVNADWMGEWRSWCRDILTRRRVVERSADRVPLGLFD